MNISYDLWPIWCDYLEENGQDTELLRYVMTYGAWNVYGYVFTSRFFRGVSHHVSFGLLLLGDFGNGISYSSFYNDSIDYGCFVDPIHLYEEYWGDGSMRGYDT